MSSYGIAADPVLLTFTVAAATLTVAGNAPVDYGLTADPVNLAFSVADAYLTAAGSEVLTADPVNLVFTVAPATLRTSLQMRADPVNLNFTVAPATLTFNPTLQAAPVNLTFTVAPASLLQGAGLVSTTDQLQTAIAAASAGDTIRLAPGTYPERLVIGKTNPGAAITITSADPNNRAKLSNFDVRDSSGLSFTYLELITDQGAFTGLDSAVAIDPYPFRFTRSDHVTLDHCNIHGSLDGNPSNDRDGLLVQSCTNVPITNCEFHELADGIITDGGSGGAFTDNYFHDLRSDGIHGSMGASVRRNLFTRFFPASGDHPDCVQFFEEHGVAPDNITIADNLYVRGAGSAAQGLFNRIEDSSTERFDNISITGNLLIGTLYRGITVLGGNNVTVSDNDVAWFADTPGDVWIGNSANITETNNTASAFIYGNTSGTNTTPTNTNTSITTSGNTITSASTSADVSTLVNAWLVDHPDMTWVLPLLGL